MIRAPLNGLVLAGGQSRRMRHDKAAIRFSGPTALESAFELLQQHTGSCFVSIRAEQADDPLRSKLPQIVDGKDGAGPLAGIIAALRTDPASAWLVVACDLPLLSNATLELLLAGRGESSIVTAFASAHDGLPEPLCAIYEPTSLPVLLEYAARDIQCPRKILLREQHRVTLLPAAGEALDNINTPGELAELQARLASGGAQ